MAYLRQEPLGSYERACVREWVSGCVRGRCAAAVAGAAAWLVGGRPSLVGLLVVGRPRATSGRAPNVGMAFVQMGNSGGDDMQMQVRRVGGVSEGDYARE